MRRVSFTVGAQLLSLKQAQGITRVLPHPCAGPLPEPAAVVSAYFEIGGRQLTPAYQLQTLSPGHVIPGPAILIDVISTIVVEPGGTAHITGSHDIRIDLHQGSQGQGIDTECDPIQLAIFSHR